MMEYNTTRDKLMISEYGRNVQKLVKLALEIKDRDLRTKFAKNIVQIMGQINPSVRDSGDFRHKLWDHLHIISDFELDVDAPYPAPSREVLEARPERLAYSDNNIRFKIYGSNIERIIEKASLFEDGPEKDALVHAIANHLKKSYLSWNRESVDDEQIFEHLRSLSNGKLALKEELRLHSTNEILLRNKKKKVTPPPPGKGLRKGRKGMKRKTN
ncbi:MAG: DUF4290 domain-containing protein [Bacteroidales bacterium]